MGVGSGLAAQWGLKAETTAGTEVTVDRFYPVRSWRPDNMIRKAKSAGLRAGAKAVTDDRAVLIGRNATAETEIEVLNKGFGLLLAHLIGGSGAATQIGTTTVYRQIHTVGDLMGKSLTVQAGVPESYGSGTVRPYTYRGVKVPEWEIACSPSSAEGLLLVRPKLDAWTWTTGTGLAAASYLTGVEPFRWGGDGTNAFFAATIGGAVTTTAGRTTITGGTTIKGLRGVSLKGANPQRVDRFLGGNAGVKSEQLENGFREYGGELDTEFADRTQLIDVAEAYTSTALQFTWQTSTAINGQYPTLRITYPIVKLSGSPEVGGPDIVDGKTTFEVFLDNAGVHPLMQIEYESVDTAV